MSERNISPCKGTLTDVPLSQILEPAPSPSDISLITVLNQINLKFCNFSKIYLKILKKEQKQKSFGLLLWKTY